MEEIQLSSLETSLEPSPSTLEDITSPASQSIYHPLPPMHIRVLDILPVESINPDPDNEPVRAEIRVIDLENDPKFNALSYVWGTFSPEPDTIDCGNVKVSVSINCLSSLRHLRKTLGKFTIWVDAVCINQNDQAEKEQQIPLMGEIYTLSESVYVWLGEGTIRTDKAMAYLLTAGLQEFHSNSTEGSKSRPYAAVWAIFIAQFKREKHIAPYSEYKRDLGIKPRGEHTTLAELRELLSSVWISRLWTYQEILLASNPVVVCGNFHVPWSILERSVLFLENTSSFDHEGITTPWSSVALSREQLQRARADSSTRESTDLESYISFIKKVNAASAKFYGGLAVLACLITLAVIVPLEVIDTGFDPQKVSVKTLLQFVPLAFLLVFLFLLRVGSLKDRAFFTDDDALAGLYLRSATEPKDMAYGTWAVLERRGCVDLPAIDYSQDIGEIYRIFAIRISQITQSLDLLLLAAIKSSKNQPSWTPDWSATNTHEWYKIGPGSQITNESGQHLYRGMRSTLRDIFFPFGYAAMISLNVQFKIDSTETYLTVNARRVCSIQMCLRFRPTSEHFDPNEEELHLENLRLMLIASKARFSKILRVLVRGTTFPDFQDIKPARPYEPRLGGPTKREISKLMSFYRENVHKDLAQTFERLRNKENLYNTQVSVCRVLSERSIIPCFVIRLGDTNGFEWIGLCSRDVIESDEALRFTGVPQLLITRAFPEGVGKGIKLVSPIMLLEPISRWPFRKPDETPLEEYNIY